MPQVLVNEFSVLINPLIRRERFDPSNQEHLESFDVFLKTGNWGDVQFFPELPYIEVPMTVLMKYAAYQRKVNRETAAERSKRIAAKSNLVEFVPQTVRQQRAGQKAALAASNDVHKNILQGLDAAASD